MTVQILDGGLGTSLEDQYDVHFNASLTPLWSSHFIVEKHETLLACQRDFTEAGVDVLLTATYQVSISGFARTKTAAFPHGIPKSAIGACLKSAVDIAEKAKVHEDTRLALSLGPYGASMIPGQEYSGAYDVTHDCEDALYAWHLERLRLFTDVEGLAERVQYIALETIPRLDEIAAVRRAVYDSGIKARLWISCVFPREDEALPDGSSVEQVVKVMLRPVEGQATPWGVGINCTKIYKLTGLIEKFEQGVAKMRSDDCSQSVFTLVLYPDGTNGEVYNTTTQKWEKPERQSVNEEPKKSWAGQLSDIVRDAQKRGVFESFLVGGCCKASAVDIKGLRAELKDFPGA